MKSLAAFVAGTSLVLLVLGTAAAAPSDAEIQKAAAECFGMAPTNWTTMANSCTTIINLQQASAGNKARAYYNRGEAYLRLGGGQNAYEDFSAAIKLKPKFPMALIARAGILAGKGQLDRAMSDLNAAIDANPKVAAAYSNRGIVYMAKHEFAKAIADLDKAVELDPADAESYAIRGSAYASSGDNTRALGDLNKALQMNPHALTALFNRGKVYVAMKETAKAKADFQAVLALDPDNKLAKEQLQALGGV